MEEERNQNNIFVREENNLKKIWGCDKGFKIIERGRINITKELVELAKFKAFVDQDTELQEKSLAKCESLRETIRSKSIDRIPAVAIELYHGKLFIVDGIHRIISADEEELKSLPALFIIRNIRYELECSGWIRGRNVGLAYMLEHCESAFKEFIAETKRGG